MSIITLVAIDGALANIGMVAAHYNLDTGDVTPVSIKLQTTDKLTGKVVRQSSDDIRRGRENAIAVADFAKRHSAAVLIGEVPAAPQSHRACFAFGMTTQLYASASVAIPFVEVSPREVKEASVGARGASKDEMIRWATTRWPDLPWFMYRGAYQDKNEHIADACGALVAGIETVQFAQAMAMLRSVRQLQAA